MISIALILALTTVAITALAKFWKNIVEWIKKAAKKVEDVLKVAVAGTRTFISKVAGSFKNKSKYYYQNKVTNEYEEVVYTKEVDPSEIPSDIKAKLLKSVEGADVSTTEELRLLLEKATA